MKILLVTHHFPPELGGASVVYYRLALHLGAEMSVLGPKTRGGSSESDKGHAGSSRSPAFGIGASLQKRSGRRRLLRTRIDLFKRLVVDRVSVGLGLIRQFLRSKPDVVCLAQPTLYWTRFLIKWFTKAPVIFYIHGEEFALANAEEFTKVQGQVAGFLYKRAIQGFAKPMPSFRSANTAANLIRFGVGRKQIRVIYNGVDHQQFTPGERDSSVMTRHGLWGKRVLLTLARLDPRKGQDMVIRAMPAILKVVPDAVYVIAGAGSDRGRLEQLVESLSLQQYVIFAGRVPDQEVCAYYRSCDLFIHPNRNMPDGDTEGFGLVFLEAGACGKPVIGGNAGGVPEAVVHGETGLIVNGESHAEVADAAIRILCDPETADRFSSNGRTWAARFSWEATARNFRDICVELVRPTRARPIGRQSSK